MNGKSMQVFLKNKLTRKILISSFTGIILSGVTYCLILPFILNYSGEERIEFWKKLAIIVPALGTVSTIIFYLLYRKAETVINLIDAGIKPADDVLVKARDVLSNMNLYYMLLGLVFYPLGAVINVLPNLMHGTVQFDNLLSRMLGAFFWGALAGLLTARTCNIFLLHAKSQLNIYFLDTGKTERRKDTFIKRFFIPLFFLVILVFSFCVLGYYHFSKETINQKNVMVKDVLDKATASSDTGEGLAAYYEAINTPDYIREIRFPDFVVIMALLFLTIMVIVYILLYEYRSHINYLNAQITRLTKEEMDLSRRINIISFDEVGQMTSGINKILINLTGTFKSVKNSSKDLFDYSKEAETLIQNSKKETKDLNRIIEAFETNSASQKESVDKTVNMFSNMLQTIDNSIKNITLQVISAMNTSNLFKEMINDFNAIHDDAEKINSVFKELIISIDESNLNINNSLASIEEINVSGSKINEIATIIKQIASRTNLLAMNAAIEAAHAGEFGKGFAVVAEEIRSLSENTSKSAKDISSLIKEVSGKIDKGSRVIQNTKSIFDVMNQAMLKTKDFLLQITSTTQKQAEIANSNLSEIHALLNTTNSMKKETDLLKKDSREIEQSIISLRSTLEDVKATNLQLTAEIKNIVSVFDNISDNFKVIYERIKDLEGKTSNYITGDA